MAKDKKVLMGDEITLEQWLSFMKEKPKDIQFEDYMLPSEAIKNEFISNIHTYDEHDIRRILMRFLDFTGLLGSDRINMMLLLKLLKDNKEEANQLVETSSYHRRLAQVAHSGGKLSLYGDIQWVIDLLPDSPRDALNVIGAFLTIHIIHLPDGRIHGLSDAESIIRARYFDAKTDNSVLYSLDPTEFEHVVEALYHEMGYSTKMTKATHDGGRDIIADKIQPGSKEHIVISCKRVRATVEPADYREIMAVVEDEKATKGAVVTTSDFSSEAHQYAKRNPRIELIGQEDLQKMLNEYLGTTWNAHLVFYINQSKQRHPKENRV
ncbi:MAG TPA: restriction endonuclease [Candidatus Saccharimonadales bacterium]|nr:restriction endonuclease [Candidatus Saccharimonadales bacterium]